MRRDLRARPRPLPELADRSLVDIDDRDRRAGFRAGPDVLVEVEDQRAQPAEERGIPRKGKKNGGKRGYAEHRNLGGTPPLTPLLGRSLHGPERYQICRRRLHEAG